MYRYARIRGQSQKLINFVYILYFKLQKILKLFSSMYGNDFCRLGVYDIFIAQRFFVQPKISQFKGNFYQWEVECADLLEFTFSTH